MANKQVLISVAEEVHEHFDRVKSLAEEIVDSEESKDADRISAVKALSSEIKMLSEIQEKVYNTERIALLEQAVIEVLREYSPEVQGKVMVLFEEKRAKASE
jgi:hypothetical protein